MKSKEQLERLAKNPFYTLSADEQEELNAYNEQEKQPKKKSSTSPKKHGNATVKRTGKLDKHPSDPVVE